MGLITILFKTRLRLIYFLIVFLSLLVICSGCKCSYFSDRLWLIEPFKGRVEDNRYYSENNFFSVDIPIPAQKGYIIDDPNEFEGSVIFANEFNYYLKIEIVKPSSDILTRISLQSENRELALELMFCDYLLPAIKKVVPQAELLHETNLTLENGREAVFAIFDLPGGAVIYGPYGTGNLRTDKGAIHGFFFTFSEENYLICFTMQDMRSLRTNPSEIILDSTKSWMLRNILESYNTFKISEH